MPSDPNCWYYTEEIAKTANSAAILANDISICSLNIVAIPLNVFFNGFVITKYLKTRSHQPVSNTLLFLLAVFDFLQGIIPQPLFTTIIILKLHRNFQCSFHTVIRTMIPVFSGISFVIATIVLTTDRLLAVVYPIWHRFIMKKDKVIMVILLLLFVWVTAVSVGRHCFYNRKILSLAFLFFIALGLIYTVMVYVKIYFICWGDKNNFLGKYDNKVCVNSTSLPGSISEKSIRAEKHGNILPLESDIVRKAGNLYISRSPVYQI